MRFEELDIKMRVYEKSLNQMIIPDMYLVARLDGRNFTRLTKEICKFDAPYDERFRDYMVTTMRHLLRCGFRTIYAYTQSDEISLLFPKDETTFARNARKYNSILAGEASAAFTHALGTVAAFDCRMIPLPNIELVLDYFRWRQEDAHRNSLNSHCYWLLRREGLSASEATAKLEGQSVSFKNELLFEHGINFNDLPRWQKRGIGYVVGQVDDCLYYGEKYIDMVRSIIEMVEGFADEDNEKTTR
jgi:tRNA(His) 5'-end guanylyltransferase